MSSWRTTSITKETVSTNDLELATKFQEALNNTNEQKETSNTSTGKVNKPSHTLTKKELEIQTTKACLPLQDVAKVFAVVLKGVATVKEAWDILKGNEHVLSVEEELEEVSENDTDEESEDELGDLDDIKELAL